MPCNNTNLKKRRKEPNDELYTKYEYIALEIPYYKEHLRGKRIYLPCDDFRWSNFVKYFRDNFEDLGLLSMTSTCYDIGDGAWKYTYDGTMETATLLNGNGDFRSAECTSIKNDSDIVITNPPFSQWRDFIIWLHTPSLTDYIILGTINNWYNSYSLPYFLAGSLNIGYTKRGGDEMLFKDRRGDLLLRNTCWYTSFKAYSYSAPPLELTETYDPGRYPFYDNYPGIINVDKSREIPKDYDGLMGVPVSFLRLWSVSQFEILNVIPPNLNGRKLFQRAVIRRRK